MFTQIENPKFRVCLKVPSTNLEVLQDPQMSHQSSARTSMFPNFSPQGVGGWVWSNFIWTKFLLRGETADNDSWHLHKRFWPSMGIPASMQLDAERAGLGIEPHGQGSIQHTIPASDFMRYLDGHTNFCKRMKQSSFTMPWERGLLGQ